MGRTKRARDKRRRFQKGVEASTRADFMPELFRYLAAVGWKNDTQLSVRYFPNVGRGLCSKERKFTAGDELIRLPLKSLISGATLENDDDFKAYFNTAKCTKEQRISFQSLMAFYVLLQKHQADASSIATYIKNLPASFATPYFCSLAELQCLPEDVLEKTVAQNRQIRTAFQNIQTCFFDAEFCDCCGQRYFTEIYTLNEFKWAYFVVNTRSVYVDSRQLKSLTKSSFFAPLLSDASDLALAPFLDLFNHADFVTTKAEIQPSRDNKTKLDFVIKLQESASIIRPHSQLFISYGAHTNLKLFLEYGFIIPNNKHDYFEFSLHDVENFINNEKSFNRCTFHSNKFRFIRCHNLHDQMFVHFEEGPSHNLHVVLHLLLKEQSHFPNVLNQVAFGAVDQLEDVGCEVALLVKFKIKQYERFGNELEKLPELSESGMMAKLYLEESIHYLQKYLNTRTET